MNTNNLFLRTTIFVFAVFYVQIVFSQQNIIKAGTANFGADKTTPLPFIEDWSSGNFTANNWTFDPSAGNWDFFVNYGNPAPSVKYQIQSPHPQYSYSLVTPSLDGTTITGDVRLQYDLYLDTYFPDTLESIAVEVFDGTNWHQVNEHVNTNGSFEFYSSYLDITEYAAGNNFKVRFRAFGDEAGFSVSIWFLDNIKIYNPSMGTITGTVTSMAGLPIEGATVTISEPFSSAVSTNSDGVYTISNLEAGEFLLTIEKEGFNTLEDSVAVFGNQVVTEDYQLSAPNMVVSADTIFVDVPIGQTKTDTITITNDGNGNLYWNGYVRACNSMKSIPPCDGKFPRGEAQVSIESSPVINRTKSMPIENKFFESATAYAFDITPGNSFFTFNTNDPSSRIDINYITINPFGASFDAENKDFLYIIDFSDSHLKKVKLVSGEIVDIGLCESIGETTWTGIAVDKATNIMYGVATDMSDSYIYTIDMQTAIPTLIGPSGISCCIDITIDNSGDMYAYDIMYDSAYVINKETGVASSLGSIGFDANFDQGMGYDEANDIVYLAAFNNFNFEGELRILDRETGNTDLVGSLGCEVDGLAFPRAEFARIQPKSGMIQPNSTQEVVITFNGDYVPESKNHTVNSDLIFSPLNGVSDTVKLAMTIEGELFGNIEGTVAHSGELIEGATITITKEEFPNHSCTEISDENGAFSFPSIVNGNYTIKVQKHAYNNFNVESIVVTGGDTTVLDIALLAPTIDPDPSSIVETVDFGNVATKTITITNNGDGALHWNGYVLADQNKGNITNQTKEGLNGVSSGIINSLEEKKSGIELLKGSNAYAFRIDGSRYFFDFDTDNPSSHNVITNTNVVASCGAFNSSDKTKMYAIDQNYNKLMTICTSTGDITYLGACFPVGAQSNWPHKWTGLAFDKTTDILYAVSTNFRGSFLYTIDPNTAEATVIGPIGIHSCFDIAIDGTGQMYGYDISYDVSYKIDKATGSSTELGYIGFDANYSQGMGWDPETDNIYLSAFNFDIVSGSGQGELRMLDRETGGTSYLGLLGGEVDALDFPGGGSAWLTIYPNTGTIEPGSSMEVTVTMDGSYLASAKDYTLEGNIVISSKSDIVDTIAVELSVLLAVDDFKNGLMKLYPNPASNEINIEANSIIHSIKLTNSAGMVVFSEDKVLQNKFTFNTSNLSSGIYFLHVNNDRGECNVNKVQIIH